MLAPARVVLPRGCRPRAALWAAVRLELEPRERKTPEREREKAGKGKPRRGTVGGKEPTARAHRTALFCRAAACCRASRPGRGASVSGPHPPRRVAVSSSTSGAFLRVARWGRGASGGGISLRAKFPSAAQPRRRPVARDRSAGGSASGAGQPQPSTPSRVPRVPRTRGRLSEGRVPPGRREAKREKRPASSEAEAAQRSRLLARGGAGRAGRRGRPLPRARPPPLRRSAAGGGGVPCRAAVPRPRRLPGLRWASAAAAAGSRRCHAATVASAMPLPRVGAVKEPGRSGLAGRWPAVRGGPAPARACASRWRRRGWRLPG